MLTSVVDRQVRPMGVVRNKTNMLGPVQATIDPQSENPDPTKLSVDELAIRPNVKVQRRVILVRRRSMDNEVLLLLEHGDQVLLTGDVADDLDAAVIILFELLPDGHRTIRQQSGVVGITRETESELHRVYDFEVGDIEQERDGRRRPALHQAQRIRSPFGRVVVYLYTAFPTSKAARKIRQRMAVHPDVYLEHVGELRVRDSVEC